MKSSPGRLAFAFSSALGLALAHGAAAGDTFEALLVGANEVPEPGLAEGSFEALVVVEGTRVTLTLTPRGIRGWMSVHIHKGAAGVTAGKLVAEFPWSSGDGSPRMSVGSVFPKVAADMAANPQNYYVHVHTPSFPAGAARGQLSARAHGPALPSAVSGAATAMGYDPRVASGAEPANLDTYVAGHFGGAPDTIEAPLPAPVPSPTRGQTIDFESPRSRVYRDPDFRLEASASSGLPVFFTGSGDCTVSGSTVHILSAGKCWVTAHQPGDSRFEAAPDVEQRIPIGKAGQRIGGAAPATKTYLDPDFPVAMSATSGLALVFFAWGDCTVSGSYIHITGAGSCSFTAHQPGDPNYLAATIVDQQFPIAKADQTIEFAEFPNPYYGNYDLMLGARASSGLPVSYGVSGPCTVVGASLRVLDSGTCSVTADQGGDRNFNAGASVTRTFEIVLPAAPQ